MSAPRPAGPPTTTFAPTLRPKFPRYPETSEMTLCGPDSAGCAVVIIHCLPPQPLLLLLDVAVETNRHRRDDGQRR